MDRALRWWLALSPVRQRWFHWRRFRKLRLRDSSKPHLASQRNRMTQRPGLPLALETMLRVPTVSTLDDLAHKIGLPLFVLTRYIFQADQYYKVFRLLKRSGIGYRRIAAPSQELKGIQRWIKTFITSRVPLPKTCMAFRQGLSIYDNAKLHIKKDFVLSIDIEDFFPSVTTPRVHGLFRSLGYGKEISFGFSHLTTLKGELPQGAPSSPDIANLVCRHLDKRIEGFCKGRGWTYSRYCDDISISGNGNCGKSGGTIREIIESEGFRINPRKTRLVRYGRRQLVTGLVVNERPNVPRRRRRAIRAMFHQAKLLPNLWKRRLSELEGHLAFLHMVNPDDSLIPAGRDVIATLRSAS